MPLTPQTVYYSLAAVGLVAGGLTTAVVYLVKVVKFFTTLDINIKGMSQALDKILNNHLPHIYERLGAHEARQNQISYSRRVRELKEDIRPHPDVKSVVNGGHASGLEDEPRT